MKKSHSAQYMAHAPYHQECTRLSPCHSQLGGHAHNASGSGPSTLCEAPSPCSRSADPTHAPIPSAHHHLAAHGVSHANVPGHTVSKCVQGTQHARKNTAVECRPIPGPLFAVKPSAFEVLWMTGRRLRGCTQVLCCVCAHNHGLHGLNSRAMGDMVASFVEPHLEVAIVESGGQSVPGLVPTMVPYPLAPVCSCLGTLRLNSCPGRCWTHPACLRRIRDIIESADEEILGVRMSKEQLKVALYLSEICARPVDWELATSGSAAATHFFDFGPGGANGVGSLILLNKKGSGAEFIAVPELHDVPWPRQVHSALLNASKDALPPVMVVGMTPTTVSGDFVASVLNAGYQFESAAGGLHFSEAMLRNKVKYVMSRVEPGNAITLNMMFLNLATTLASCGIKHIAFKPGSADTISQVVRICRAPPRRFPSFCSEPAGALHYAAIRRCRNLLLVAGSGFGGVDDTLPYMTGDSLLAFNRPRMPFDAVFFGSRMMVAKEAKTLDVVKDLIVACPGVDDEANWEQSYTKPMGGVITVRSELGEPIHKVATRGMMLWKGLDDTMFTLPKNKRIAALREKKAYMIDRLNMRRFSTRSATATIIKPYYTCDESTVPKREYLTNFMLPSRPSTKNLVVSISGPKRVFELASTADKLPSHESWMATDNYLPRLLLPRTHIITIVSPSELSVQLNEPRGMAMSIRLVNKSEIVVTLTHVFDEQRADFELSFVHSPSTPFALIREKLEGCNRRIKDFYAALWSPDVVDTEVRSYSAPHTVSRDAIVRFCKVVGNGSRLPACAAGWKAVVQPLFSGLVDGDLLKLVHLNNFFKVLVRGSLVYAGDQIQTDAEVVSMTNTPTGKKITVKGVLSRVLESKTEALVEVTSSLFVRGAFDDYHRPFNNIEEEPVKLTLRRPQDLAVLKSREYIQFNEQTPAPIVVGTTLVFRLKTHVEYQSSAMIASEHTTGVIEQVHKEQVHTVSAVDFACDHPQAIQVSPVVTMLQRLGGETVELPRMFDGNGYKVQASTVVAVSLGFEALARIAFLGIGALVVLLVAVLILG
ncbi:hypothetical protein BCR44DRAFT_32907 [Catenaria anguillulae PL171]|uniref:Uncharacterized protein n=1 Tax=Catenaria anguillulae PL171 TaxID=765915 RepID=A0A1Y2H4G5_9FUNG|nr:hypothetical protein BCR44DRAFT_32907 [Catenaria anguillulae PL171]